MSLQNHDCKFEERIIKMSEDIASIKTTVETTNTRVNGSMDEMNIHVEEGMKWRIAIVISMIGMIGLVVSSIIRWGIVLKTVDINEAGIARNTQKIEKMIDRLDTYGK